MMSQFKIKYLENDVYYSLKNKVFQIIYWIIFLLEGKN